MRSLFFQELTILQHDNVVALLDCKVSRNAEIDHVAHWGLIGLSFMTIFLENDLLIVVSLELAPLLFIAVSQLLLD